MVVTPAVACSDVAPEQLNPEWFSHALGWPVRAVATAPVGDGLVGLTVRCTLTRHDGTTRSVIVKLASTDPTSRATGVAMRNYEREVRFYAELAPTVDIRVPSCFHAEWREEDGSFVLVLEDLAPARQGDQVAGCTVEEAEAAVVELGRLHGPRWGDPALDEVAWLSRRAPGDVERLAGLYRTLWPGFAASVGRLLPDHLVALGERVAEVLDPWLSGRVPPFTVLHGDFRLDNLLFGTADGRVGAVDWQTPAHGPGWADLAYFLGTSLTVPDRRASERHLVARYVEVLAEEGAVVDDAWDAYRREALAGAVMAVVASQIVRTSERSEAMFAAMAGRSLQQAVELDTMALLEAS